MWIRFNNTNNRTININTITSFYTEKRPGNLDEYWIVLCNNDKVIAYLIYENISKFNSDLQKLNNHLQVYNWVV